MIIVKKTLPRRTFLRGAGVVMALPLLDAMVPALSAFSRTAAGSVRRLGFFYVANGMYLPDFHPAGDGGTSFELTPILQPLASFRNEMVVSHKRNKNLRPQSLLPKQRQRSRRASRCSSI